MQSCQSANGRLLGEDYKSFGNFCNLVRQQKVRTLIHKSLSDVFIKHYQQVHWYKNKNELVKKNSTKSFHRNRSVVLFSPINSY